MKTYLFPPLYLQRSDEGQIFKNSFMEDVYKVIDENLDEPSLGVGYLAVRMAVSKSTLNRKLLACAGLSANELIRNCRLKKAAAFLLAGRTVSEAAYLTGFETPSYFTQCFKELYKVTPKEYSRTHSFYWPR